MQLVMNMVKQKYFVIKVKVLDSLAKVPDS